MALTGISPFLPLYIENLGVQDTKHFFLWSGLVVAAPAVSYAICTPFWGRLTDRSSKKWMVIRALLGLALSVLFMGLVNTPFQLFLCRIFQGAFGGISDSSTAFIASEVHKSKQGKIIGKLHSASSTGLLLGPLIGGMLIGIWGFSNLLLLMGSLVFTCTFLAIFLLREEKRKITIINSTDNIISTFVILYKNRELRFYIIAGIFAKIGDFGIFSIFSPYVKSFINSPNQAAIWVGILIASTSIGEMIGAPWWGKRNDLFPVEKNYFFATILCGVFVLLQGFTENLSLLLIIRFFQGFFFSALIQTIMFFVIQKSNKNNQGVRIGATNSILVTGQIIGSFIGSIIGSYLGLNVVFFLMGLVFILSSIFVRYSRPTKISNSSINID